MLMSHLVPVAYLDLAAKYNGFQLASAQLVGEDKVYTDFFIEEAKQGKHVVIYDPNGLIDDATLLRKAKLIDAKEVVAPYEFMDYAKTIEKLKKFLSLKRVAKLDVMLVPQGHTIKDWTACVNSFVTEKLVDHPSAKYVGLQACSIALAFANEHQTSPDDIYGTRPKAFFMVRDRLNKLKVHLFDLGHRGGRELMEYRFDAQVHRCSTTVAYVLANNKIQLGLPISKYRAASSTDFECPAMGLLAYMDPLNKDIHGVTEVNIQTLNNLAGS